MKKLYTLAIALFSTLAIAQTNGGFEDWTDGAPAPWTIILGSNGGSITQSTSIVHSGSSAVALTAPTGTGNNRIQYIDIDVTEGQSCTISYWYNDNDNNARFRHWGSFRNSEGALASGLQPAAFQPSTYNANTSGWQQITVNATAPTGATSLRVDFRVFQQANDASGGTVYLDDVVITPSTASIKDNAIPGLSIYPNPVTDGTLNIKTLANAEKSVQIFDVLGKNVLNTVTSGETVNVTSLNSGVYIVKITEEGHTASRKLVIK